MNRSKEGGRSFDVSALQKYVLHVISTNKAALANLLTLYKNDGSAILSFSRATDIICTAYLGKGRVIATGIGKSGVISNKLVACLNSLGIPSYFLHPAEALHGDLGMIGANDVLVLLSYSGRSPELLDLMNHISATTPVIVLTGCTNRYTCPLILRHPRSTVVPVPTHEPESVSFGVPLPSTSCSVALVVCDSLALATAHRIHTSASHSIADVFHGHHPGGAIGAHAADGDPRAKTSVGQKSDLSRLVIPVTSIPIVRPSEPDGQIRVVDVALTAISTSTRWVRIEPMQFIGPRGVLRLLESTMESATAKFPCNESPFISREEDRVCIPETWTLRQCRQYLLKLQKGEIVSITANMRTIGVAEIEDIVKFDANSIWTGVEVVRSRL